MQSEAVSSEVSRHHAQQPYHGVRKSSAESTSHRCRLASNLLLVLIARSVPKVKLHEAVWELAVCHGSCPTVGAPRAQGIWSLLAIGILEARLL